MVQPSAERPQPAPGPTLALRFEQAGAWLPCAGAALACAVALFAFGTWWWGDWRIGTGNNTIPMAPSTALLMMVLGATLLLHLRWGGKTAMRRVGFVVAGIAAVPAIIAVVRSVTGFEAAWERSLFQADDMVRGIPVGRMSPLTAGVFLLAAISFAALLPPLAGRKWLHRAGLLAASVGEIAVLIVALAYASGTPLFYDGRIIPMAFLTATAFAALFAALLSTAVAGAGRRPDATGARHVPPASPWYATQQHLLVVFGVLALAIGLAGFFSLRVRQTAMRERIAGELEAIADLKVGQIVNWRNERLGDARLLMQTPALARAAAAVIATPNSAAMEEMLAYIGVLQKTYRYEAVVLYDQRMNPRLAVPPTPLTVEPQLRALLEAAPTATEPLLSDLHRTTADDIYMDFVAPLRDWVAASADRNSAAPQPVGSPIGAILLRIDPRDFLYPLIQKWPVPSETGETLLVRRDGDEVLYLNDLRHRPGTALSPVRRSIHDEQIPAVMGARGFVGVIEGVDYRGVAVLAAVRPVPNSPWVLVAKEDQSEIYEPLRRQALAMAGIVMSLLLGAALGIAHLSRRTSTDSLQRELAAETQRRSLAERLALITQHANDIILLTDETGRIVEANDRAVSTYGYSLEELRRLPPGGLRPAAVRGTLPRQHALSDSPDGAIFEALHRRKDGTIFPVEVSGRSVEVDGHKVRLGIFRDITERKHAEEARREAEEKYRSIFENALEGIFQTTPQGTFLAANPAMARILGYASPEELIRERTEIARQGYVDPNHREEFKRRIEADGAISGFEYEAYRKDGSRVWVAENARVVRDAQGRVVCYEGSLDDITERKRVEGIVRESERRFREMMENLELIAITLDPNGTIIFCNDFLLRLVGRKREEVIGHSWFREFLPDSGRTVEKMFHDTIRTGTVPVHFQNPIRIGNGENRQIAWNNMVLRDGSGNIVGVASIGEDVTDRLRAEAALRQSEERYRLLFDNNPLPMWVYDLATLRFLAVNECAVQHYGFTRAEFLAMTIRDIRPPEDIPSLVQTIRANHADSGGTLATRHRRKDGRVFPVELVSRPIVFDGRDAGLALASDVTEKKLLQEQFLHAQRLESIGMLAAGIAHDLNNVLAPIVFAAPMLRESLSAPRDLQILNTLEQSAGRGAGLVKQILGFVHRTSDEFAPTQVKHLARDIIGVIEETFPKSIQFEQSIPSNLWPVQGNPTQIHQVLLNLCVNARDAMPEGGTLQLTATNRVLDAVEAAAIPGARPGPWLVLEVADTGTGMTPEVLKHIWTPFFTTKGEGKGTGLGLSTVRGIVASHQGFVELQTAVGRGSTFRVYLPAIESAAAPTPGATAHAVFVGRGELILVVDDDAAIRQIVGTILRKHRYRVVSCGDGLEALTVFGSRRSEISLVVTDVDMPRLGGVALARAVVQLQPDTRLIAMSGLSRNDGDGSGISEIKNLAHAFLLKPFSPEDLLGTVHRLLHAAEKNTESPLPV